MSGPKPKIPIILLAGGLGTRLREYDGENPKPMVEVENKPFLFWLVKKLFLDGFDCFYFSLGYKAEKIIAYPWNTFFPECQFNFDIEKMPLGTGGAVKQIIEKNKIDLAWIINGDTLLEKKIPSFEIPKENLGVYLVLKKENIFDDVLNVWTQNDKIDRIAEGGKYLDAGAILLKTSLLKNNPVFKTPISIHELLKPQIEKNKILYKIQEGRCFDIGTKTRIERFKQFLKETKWS